MTHKFHPIGLSELKDKEIKKLLGHIYRQELTFPLTAQSIACIGFQYRHEQLMGVLRNVNAEGAQAVLICIMAERLSCAEKLKRLTRQLNENRM